MTEYRGAGNTGVAARRRPTVPSDVPAKPVRPRQLGGLLRDSLGTYITIEGVLYDGFQEKVESNTLLVDTVDGKKLEEVIQVLIRDMHPSRPRRMRLQGFRVRGNDRDPAGGL